MLNDEDCDETGVSSGLADHRSDLALVRRMHKGDRSAFDEFVAQVLPVLQRFAASRLRTDPEVVRDVVQSTLCKAIESLPGYRGEGALLSWVCGICRFEIFALFKDRQRAPYIGLFEENAEMEKALARVRLAVDDPEQSLVEDEVRSMVHLTLDSLPGNYGRLLELKYCQAASVREIALDLGLSEKAVESRLTRARAAFKTTYASIVRDITGRHS